MVLSSFSFPLNYNNSEILIRRYEQFLVVRLCPEEHEVIGGVNVSDQPACGHRQLVNVPDHLLGCWSHLHVGLQGEAFLVDDDHLLDSPVALDPLHYLFNI